MYKSIIFIAACLVLLCEFWNCHCTGTILTGVLGKVAEENLWTWVEGT